MGGLYKPHMLNPGRYVRELAVRKKCLQDGTWVCFEGRKKIILTRQTTVDGCEILHHRKDGRNPINNGMNHLSTGAGLLDKLSQIEYPLVN